MLVTMHGFGGHLGGCKLVTGAVGGLVRHTEHTCSKHTTHHDTHIQLVIFVLFYVLVFTP